MAFPTRTLVYRLIQVSFRSDVPPNINIELELAAGYRDDALVFQELARFIHTVSDPAAASYFNGNPNGAVSRRTDLSNAISAYLDANQVIQGALVP